MKRDGGCTEDRSPNSAGTPEAASSLGEGEEPPRFPGRGSLTQGSLKGEGAGAAVSSVSDYVVNWWVLALAAIAGERVRGVAWVGWMHGLVGAARGVFSGRGGRATTGEMTRWPARTHMARQ